MSNESLIQELIRGGYLKTPRIVEAFRRIDRRNFVLTEHTSQAYDNHPLPIGLGQTISQPLTVAFILELLAPQPGEKILEIGAGSGWLTALLACCVSGECEPKQKDAERAGTENKAKTGRVVAIERIPVLKAMAAKNVARYNYIDKKVASVVLGDGSKGYREEAPFDKIIAAAASDSLPVAWKEQVRIKGWIIAPIRDCIEIWKKTSFSDFNTQEYHSFSFVPLISDKGGNG